MGKSKKGNLRAVELFSGIGGFRIALDKAGIETVWANDFDKTACQVYRDQFGSNEIAEGDIWKLLDDAPEHDILTAGFPCQPFSAAGKKQGIEDPRGTLFEAIVKILKKHEPDYFVLENVKRLVLMDQGKHFATILDALSALDYRIEWRVLNTSWFSLPQNRQRIFITGVHHRVLERDGLDCDDPAAIKLATTEDLALLPDEIKHSVVDSAEWSPIAEHGRYFKNWGIACNGKYITRQLTGFSEAQKPVLLADVLETTVDAKFDLTESTLQRLENNKVRSKIIDGVEVISNQSGGARMGYTIFGTNGIAPTLTSSTSRHYERYFIDGRYRRLTNVEYARITGFPDKHCSIAKPLSQEYKLFGNAVAPNMVSWVVDRITKDYHLLDTKVTESQMRLYA
jgi:DNA (cytosine-5)-methyltransferase 1